MALGDAHVFTGFLTPAQTQISFQSHRQLFSHASAEAIGGNIASTGYRTHNHQVMSPTGSPLSHPGGAIFALTPLAVFCRISSLRVLSLYPAEFKLLKTRTDFYWLNDI